jgi:hypothetical protein
LQKQLKASPEIATRQVQSQLKTVVKKVLACTLGRVVAHWLRLWCQITAMKAERDRVQEKTIALSKEVEELEAERRRLKGTPGKARPR